MPRYSRPAPHPQTAWRAPMEPQPGTADTRCPLDGSRCAETSALGHRTAVVPHLLSSGRSRRVRGEVQAEAPRPQLPLDPLLPATAGLGPHLPPSRPGSRSCRNRKLGLCIPVPRKMSCGKLHQWRSELLARGRGRAVPAAILRLGRSHAFISFAVPPALRRVRVLSNWRKSSHSRRFLKIRF